jgi:transcription initiation factor TFIIB
MDYDKYLNYDDIDIDNLLMGMNIDSNKKKENRCVGCNSEKLVLNNLQGHFVCENCGMVNKNALCENPEFSGENDTARYGCPNNFYCPNSSLGTKMKVKGYSRIAAIQKQGQIPYSEKELMTTIKSIEEKCLKYGIKHNIIDTAKTLYKKIRDYKHIDGKRKGKNMIMRCINRRSMIAACVFYACKLQNEPRSPKEIADIYDLEIKHINKGYRKFLDYVNMDSFFTEFKSSQSTDFIERYSKKLNLADIYIKKAKDISINIHKLDIVSTHEPSSVAAGCILLVTKMHKLDLNKKKISDIFNISDVTISKTFRRINNYQQIITNNELTNLICNKRNNFTKDKHNITKDNLVVTEKELLSETESDNVEIKGKRGRKKKVIDNIDINDNIIKVKITKDNINIKKNNVMNI